MSVIDRYAAEKGYGYKDGFSFAVDALWALALGMYMFLVDQTYTIWPPATVSKDHLIPKIILVFSWLG